MKNSGNIVAPIVCAPALCGKAARSGPHFGQTARASFPRLTEGNMLKSKMFARAILVAVASIALSGCFDLTQSVSLGKDGAGEYRVAVSAEGFVGGALKNGKSKIDVGDNPNAHTTTVIENGVTTRTSTIPFHSLSDLSLSSETVAVHVTGHSLLGLGPTHAIFRRSFRVGDAKKSVEHNDDNDATAQGIIQSIFGNHYYTFSVTLPGTVDWIAPVYAGDVVIKPMISGNTITWRMPLENMIEAHNLNFSVGFSTWGPIVEARSRQSAEHAS
jgi:hypothetical protein